MPIFAVFLLGRRQKVWWISMASQCFALAILPTPQCSSCNCNFGLCPLFCLETSSNLVAGSACFQVEQGKPISMPSNELKRVPSNRLRRRLFPFSISPEGGGRSRCHKNGIFRQWTPSKMPLTIWPYTIAEILQICIIFLVMVAANGTYTISTMVFLSATNNSSTLKFIIIISVGKLACSNALSQCNTFSLTKLLNRVCTGIAVVPVYCSPLNIFTAILVVTSFIHSVAYMYICMYLIYTNLIHLDPHHLCLTSVKNAFPFTIVKVHW